MSLNTQIWRLAWPIILSNITIPLLGLIDIAVVGHDYPPSVLSAVAIGTMIFNVLFLLFGFLRMSTTGLVAQSPHNNALLKRALMTALTISALLILFQKFIFMGLTWFIPTDKAITAVLSDYFYSRIYAAPATLGNFVLMGYFFGRKNTKVPFILLLLINITAIILDYIFVVMLHFGVTGLAAANIMAQSVGFIAGLFFMQRLYAPFKKNTEKNITLTSFSHFFHINKDIFIRTIFLMATLATFTKMGSQLGSKVVAANAILMSLHNFSSYFLDGLAISCEALVGGAMGRKNKTDFIEAVKSSALFSLYVGLGLSIGFMLFGNKVIDCLSSLPEIVTIAKNNLIWVSLLAILSVPSFLLDGVFIGATWSKPMRNTMIISSALVFFPLVYALKPMGNIGLWLAFIGFIIARGITLGAVLVVKLRESNIVNP